MTAVILIETLSARGFTVLADGAAIKVSPSSALTDEDRQVIRYHKDELLALLRSEPDVNVELCPICGRAVEEQSGKYFKYVWCPTPGHFDSWRAVGGSKLSETDAPIIRERKRRRG